MAWLLFSLLPAANGNCFEGEFQRGVKHGQGCFFHRDSGQLQEGVWDEGVCVSSTLRQAEAAGVPPERVAAIPPVSAFVSECDSANCKYRPAFTF